MQYRVLLPNNPTKSEIFAAEELVHFIQEGTGEKLSVVTEVEEGGRYLSIGNTELFEKSGVSLQENELGEDGVRVFTKDGNAYMNALSQSGVIYSVYEFLKTQVGFEVYATDEIFVEKSDGFTLKEVDILSKPDFKGRDIHNRSVFSEPVYAMRMRSGGGVRTAYKEEHGEGSAWSKKYWGHSTFMLLPPSEYAEKHPEWYTDNKLQLCLATALEDTEEGKLMYQTFLENFKKAIADEPTAKYFIVGQEDVGYTCDREKSKAMNQKYGGEKEASSGVLILFINRVAKDIEAWLKETAPLRADEVKIVVFAYQKTQQPPVTFNKETGKYESLEEVRPYKNVIVRFAPLSSVFSKSLLDEEYNAGAREAILGWSDIGAKFSVWTYDVAFGAYEYPLYNFQVMQDTYRIFKQYGVEDILMQGPCDSASTPFLTLKNYLHSKLMWNVEQNVEALIQDFFKHYFKGAAKYVYRYFELMNAHFKTMEITKGYLAYAGIWEAADVALPRFYPKNFLEESLKLFEKAKKSAESIQDETEREKVLKRVRTEELSPRYLMLDLYRRDFDKLELDGMIKSFVKDAEELGLRTFKEGYPHTAIEKRAEVWQDALKFGTPVEWYTPLYRED